jgi:MSHA biogenesis protein MshQ
VDQYHDSSDLALTAVGTGAFSIVVRFRTTSSISKVLVSTDNGADDATFRLRITGTGFIQMRIGGGNLVTASGGLNDGGWHHVVYTYASSGLANIVYIDGVVENTGTASAYNLVGTGDLQVAADGGSALFDGDIDGVIFYDRVLTPTDVTALNNNV